MKKRVFVFGSYVTDFCSRTDRFPACGETVKGNTFRFGPGGKGSNQAIAAKRAGADVTFAAKLGSDVFGQQALAFYQSEGLSVEHILVDSHWETGAAFILVDEVSSQNQIIVIGGANSHVSEADTLRLLRCADGADILLTQLETNPEPVERLLQYAHAKGTTTILNPAPARELPGQLCRCIDILTPNETEAQFLTGIPVTGPASAGEAARQLLDRGVQRVVITMGGKGAYACDGRSERMYDTVSCGAVVDTTGAGDAFSGGLAAALARSMAFFDAVEYASVTAGLSVTRYGTAPAMPYRSEIDAVFTARREGKVVIHS